MGEARVAAGDPGALLDFAVSRGAQRLGFSDATAVPRAFKRWTGSSPRTMHYTGSST